MKQRISKVPVGIKHIKPQDCCDTCDHCTPLLLVTGLKQWCQVFDFEFKQSDRYYDPKLSRCPAFTPPRG